MNFIANLLRQYRWGMIMAAGWTGLIAASLAWNAHAERQRVLQMAELQARALVDKDLMYRRWNAAMGGVWASTRRVESNPYLAEMVEDRDVVTTQGAHLTMINPAYMSRLVFDIQQSETGIRSRIVSRKPVNPANRADSWESEVLRGAETGKNQLEFLRTTELDGRKELRYLRALPVEEACLECHRQQGYRLGDIRGGISVSVPLEPFHTASGHNLSVLGWSHGGVWLIGLIGLGAGFHRHRRNQAELCASRAHFRAVVDSALDSIVTMDRHGRIVEFNPMAEEAFGWRRGEAIGRLMSETIVPAAFREVHERGLARYLASRESRVLNQRLELTACRRDGSEFPVELTITQALDGAGNIFFTGYLRDISARKQAEAELIKAKEDAEAANRAKSEFLANMSHEIRTPMNGVIGMTDLLLDTGLDAEQREFAQIIQSSGRSLLTIINDILDFSKIEAGQLVMESFDFVPRELFDALAAMLEPAARDKGLVFRHAVADEVPALLRGDPVRLRQVLTNLAGNAIKFTAQGEVSITVALDAEEADSVCLRFTVSDTGIGIPFDKRDRLFKKFSQVDASTTRKYGGTGLGLAISQQLAELMGGEIGVESEEGQGSRFWFTARFDKSAS